jgi:hypothetical protein
VCRVGANQWQTRFPSLAAIARARSTGRLPSRRRPRRHGPRDVQLPRLPAFRRPQTVRFSRPTRLAAPPRENVDIPHHSTMDWRSALQFVGLGPLREHLFQARPNRSSEDEIEAPVLALIGAKLTLNREAAATVRCATGALCAVRHARRVSRAKSIISRPSAQSVNHRARRQHGPYFWVANEAVRRRQWSGIRGNQ